MNGLVDELADLIGDTSALAIGTPLPITCPSMCSEAAAGINTDVTASNSAVHCRAFKMGTSYISPHIIAGQYLQALGRHNPQFSVNTKERYSPIRMAPNI